MTCQDHQHAMLDLARGMAVDPSVARCAQAHLDTCPVCAATLRRQRDLTRMLTELSEHARGWRPPIALEKRLARTFAVGHEAMQGARSNASVASVNRAAAAGGIAALLALLVWGAWHYWRQDVVETEVVVRSTATPTVATATPRQAESAESLPVSAGATRVARRGHARARRSTVPALEFMPIPGTAGLPAFESGSIVRVELPVSALPSYGVEIVPDATRSAVEADVLVGQDGQARGIRLVSSTEIVPRSIR
jgi:hypothetical protein